jgi:hypothetical protein
VRFRFGLMLCHAALLRVNLNVCAVAMERGRDRELAVVSQSKFSLVVRHAQGRVQ